MSAPIPALDQAGFQFKPGDVVVVIGFRAEPVIRRVVRCVIQYTGTDGFGERFYSVVPLGRRTRPDVIDVPECHVGTMSSLQQAADMYVKGQLAESA